MVFEGLVLGSTIQVFFNVFHIILRFVRAIA
jgi:hypothetical protein